MKPRAQRALFTLAFTALLFAAQTTQASPCTTVPMRVEGGSMSPRIAPGEMIEVREGAGECLGVLHHGDVVLFRNEGSRNPLIKAIRGLPGETLAVKDGKIVINGKPATNNAGPSPPGQGGLEAVTDSQGLVTDLQGAGGER